MLARTRWITFDCYGTLVDWQRGFADALRPIAGERTGDLLQAYAAHEREAEREQPHRLYKDVLVTALARAARELRVELPPSAAHVLRQAWPSLPIFGDVEPMLEALRTNGWKVGVLTNCDEDLFEITHRSFARRFDLVLTAERVRGYKPAAWHFRGFERLTRVDRSDWVHVASSLYHDIAPARTLGVQHLWLDRGDQQGPTPEARVQSGPEVVGAAERLSDLVCHT